MKEPRIAGLAAAVPEKCYRQAEILEILKPFLSGNSYTDTIFAHAGIESRYLVVDGSYYQQERSTQERNERYMREAETLGSRAIQQCLLTAGAEPREVDDLIVVSCTGVDIPGLDLRLAGSLGMSPWLRRTCVLGMGCYGAFPGLLRAREAAVARPGSAALVLAVEICSLHFQPGDYSIEISSVQPCLPMALRLCWSPTEATGFLGLPWSIRPRIVITKPSIIWLFT